MKEILQQGWKLKYKKIQSIQNNVWYVKCEKTDYILKKSKLKPGALQYVCKAEHILTQNSFPDFAPLLKTVKDTLYFPHSRGNFTLHKVISGERCDFNQTKHLFAASKTLGNFHNHNNGLYASNHRRLKIPRHLQLFAQRCEQLKIMAEIATEKQDCFGKFFLSGYTECLSDAEFAVTELEKSTYRELYQIAYATGQFIHGDIASRNFIVSDGTAYLIDFDYCQCDIAVIDLVRLIRREMKQHRDNDTMLITILQGYCHSRPLLNTEFEIMKILLRFPQRFWRTAYRYYFEPEKYLQINAENKLEQAMIETRATKQLLENINQITEVLPFA